MSETQQYLPSVAIEEHPLSPFLPPNARILMLGSFPPPLKRWSIHFFYPNLQNDMWRIMGYLFHQDKNHFVDTQHKCFRKEDIVRFLTQRGIALFDAATSVRRLRQNASDKFLEVVRPTDIPRLLDLIPECKAIVTTGQKATDILLSQFDTLREPSIGHYEPFSYAGRSLRFYRMPSSSRAYPLSIEKKAAFYEKMLCEIGIGPDSGNTSSYSV